MGWLQVLLFIAPQKRDTFQFVGDIPSALKGDVVDAQWHSRRWGAERPIACLLLCNADGKSAFPANGDANEGRLLMRSRDGQRRPRWSQDSGAGDADAVSYVRIPIASVAALGLTEVADILGHYKLHPRGISQ